MTYAKINSIPVISISPVDSYYNKTDFEYLGQSIKHWIHPFIFELSDKIVSTVEGAAHLILNDYPFDQSTIKDEFLFFETIRHYIDTQLDRDVGMKELAYNNELIRAKIQALKSK